MIEFDNDESREKRAGDARRVLTAALHRHAGDMEALGQVMHEAKACGRAHHWTFATLDQLIAAYDLEKQPERVDEIRKAIARFTAIENGLGEGNE